MPTNLARRIVVNGEPHKIDYDALENRPFGVETSDVLFGPEELELYEIENSVGYVSSYTTELAGVSEGDLITITVGASSGTFEVFTRADKSGDVLVAGNDEFVAGNVPMTGNELGIAIEPDAFHITGPSGTQQVTVSCKTYTRLDSKYLPSGLLDGLFRQYDQVAVFDGDLEFAEVLREREV